MSQKNQTPMEQIESLFNELIKHYGEGDDRELRVAGKMLIVALDRLRRHGGQNWSSLAWEYINIAENDPEKLERILRANRSEKLISVSQ